MLPAPVWIGQRLWAATPAPGEPGPTSHRSACTTATTGAQRVQTSATTRKLIFFSTKLNVTHCVGELSADDVSQV